MKQSSVNPPRSVPAFTIIELLVVIAIIGILAAILLPALSAARIKAQVKQAQLEMGQIANAINSYHSTYSRYPVTAQAMTQATAAKEDFTYGTAGVAGVSFGLTVVNPNPPITYNANNSEVMAMLMAMTNYPSNPATPTSNPNHSKNPQQIKFLNALIARDSASGGVGPDLVYRDPWGNPYFISIDLNYDERCRDAVYRLPAVSGPAGIYGLYDPSGTGTTFEFNSGVMVWSAGPDKAASLLKRADTPPNKDNVLSWKQ